VALIIGSACVLTGASADAATEAAAATAATQRTAPAMDCATVAKLDLSGIQERRSSPSASSSGLYTPFVRSSPDARPSSPASSDSDTAWRFPSPAPTCTSPPPQLVLSLAGFNLRIEAMQLLLVLLALPSLLLLTRLRGRSTLRRACAAPAQR
jgi:hypothetical protein